MRGHEQIAGVIAAETVECLASVLHALDVQPGCASAAHKARPRAGSASAHTMRRRRPRRGVELVEKLGRTAGRRKDGGRRMEGGRQADTERKLGGVPGLEFRARRRAGGENPFAQWGRLRRRRRNFTLSRLARACVRLCIRDAMTVPHLVPPRSRHACRFVLIRGRRDAARAVQAVADAKIFPALAGGFCLCADG